MAVFQSFNPPPSRLQINGVDETSEMATRAVNAVDIGYDISRTIEGGQYRKVRAVFVVSADNFSTSSTLYGEWFVGATFIPGDNRFHYTLGGLAQNTNYRVHLYTETGGLDSISTNFSALNFWTNRGPNTPELVSPSENQTFVVGYPITFDWKFSDPDPGDEQKNYELRWRQIADDRQPGPWITRGGGEATTVDIDGASFTPNLNYEWQIRNSDGKIWGDWSLTRSLYVSGGQSPPILLSPIKDSAVDVTEPIQFLWQFRDPESGDSQHHADLRFRAVGSPNWTIIGSASTDSLPQYTMPADYLLPDYQYEWQVQTYDNGSGGASTSEWSQSSTFYAIHHPGRLVDSLAVVDLDTTPKGSLGCGNNRVFVYEQGGQVLVGEITQIAQVVWGRKRDDISNCIVDTTGFDYDCGELLKNIRCWQHELVVFRDGTRVWEGPVTRITYTSDSVEIEAKDVMGYVYRRIMRQGYNDSYNCLAYSPVANADGSHDCLLNTGNNTVVYRAGRIIADALARHDPNVLPYMTKVNNANDARQSRVIPDYSKTAWEEVDDLASSAGLDYVTVGRRIILFDTHYPIGKLPEMRDGDFTDPVVVTEYGMNLCNYYGVTDGSGVWGAAYPVGLDVSTYKGYYGPIELLSSSYGDADADANDVSTPQAVQRLREQYATQAQRNIGNRWPTPVVVRVPDNTSVNPEVNLDINHLVPGVWIPLRSTSALREVSQWQKLDSVTVTQTDRGETVQVVMGPAPHGGQDDPDANPTTGDT